MTILGSGNFQYELVEGWGKLPDNWDYADVSAVAVDRNDRVYVFNRGSIPMAVFTPEGDLVDTWGQGVFKSAHGLMLGPDDCLYCTDDGDHTVRKCSLDGKVLLEIGQPNKPAPRYSGLPFHKCTHTALSPAGDIYVTDGYGNGAVHKYDPAGRHLFSWGRVGCRPGEFNLPHNIVCDADGWVYIADRENHRIQVFDGNGKYETQINNLHRPSALYIPPNKCPFCYVGEIGPYLSANHGAPNLGPRLTILDEAGEVVARIDKLPGDNDRTKRFTSPHGIAVDSRGDLYITEVGFAAWPSLYPGEVAPKDLWCVKKFRRV